MRFGSRMSMMASMALAGVLNAAISPAFFAPNPGPGPGDPFTTSKDRRGKRKQARPKKRPNRLHISKRIRAKHRRAA